MNNIELKRKVHAAIRSQIYRRGYVAAVDVLLEIGMLTKDSYQAWKNGRVPYLERVCSGSLNKLSLVMHEIRAYGIQQNLKQSVTVYVDNGSRKPWRFSKSGDPKIERWYATHFVDAVRVRELKEAESTIASTSHMFDQKKCDWNWEVIDRFGYPRSIFPPVVKAGTIVGKMKKQFEFPDPVELDKKMRDFLIDNVSGKYYLPKKGVEFVTDANNLNKRYTQIDGEVSLCQKKNQQFNWHGDFVFVEENKDMEKTMHDLEKYFLSEKVKKYVLSTGTKGFYSRPQIDLEIARPLLTTMHKMHRAGVDNYVTTEGRIRKLTPRECLRLMGFCDSFEIAVSDTSMYQQAGNSIVVDVLIAIMTKILESYNFSQEAK